MRHELNPDDLQVETFTVMAFEPTSTPVEPPPETEAATCTGATCCVHKCV